MQNVAQSWLVYRLTHSELLLGTTWFCSQIPVFVLGPLGGVAADRYSRHRIVVLTQTAAMLQAFTLAALTFAVQSGQILHQLVRIYPMYGARILKALARRRRTSQAMHAAV